MIDRSNPTKTSGRYHVLTRLKYSLEQTISELNLDKNYKLLDYGCGDKPYKELWLKYVGEYVGADFEYNKNADVIIKNNGQLSIQSNDNDIVFSSQVLEHVKDVNNYLNNAARALKNKGTLVLSTHGVWMYHPHPDDYWRWTRSGLKEQFRKNKRFKIVRIISVMGLTATGLQLIQDGIIGKVPGKLNKYIFYIVQFLQRIFDDYDKTSHNASVFIVVAKKI